MGCEMAKLYNLEIHLENDLAVFQPRDTVAGHVLVQVGEDTTIHSCTISMVSSSDTSWTDDESVEVTAEEVSEVQNIFQSSINLLQEYTEQGVTPTEYVITQGLHLFDFEFILPANLPSSFHVVSAYGAQASVSYCLRAEVENLAFGVSHSRERGFVVIRPLDLMPHSQLRDRVTLRKEFTLSTCCTQRSGLMCDLSVNKTGFVPGETLRAEIFINNTSAKNIQTVHLTFQQNVLLRAKQLERRVIFLLFSVKLGSVAAHGMAHFHDTIHVPPMPPSGLTGCEIIDVDYMVLARMRLAGAKTNDRGLEMEIPIMLGTDPLRETSFTEASEVVPCYASFNYATGEVIEYNPERDSCERLRPVYRYYKPRPANLAPTAPTLSTTSSAMTHRRQMPSCTTMSEQQLNRAASSASEQQLNRFGGGGSMIAASSQHRLELSQSGLAARSHMIRHQESVNGVMYYNLGDEHHELQSHPNTVVDDGEEDNASYITWQSG